MRVLSETPERFYAVDVESLIPDLTHIGRSAMQKARPPLQEHTHGDALEIVCLTKGRIHYTVGNDAYTVNGGDLFLTFPHERHGTGFNPEERVHLCWIGIRIDPAKKSFVGFCDREALLLRNALARIKTRQFSAPPHVQQSIERIIDLIRSPLPYRHLLARCTLLDLAAQLVDSEKKERDRQLSLLTRRAMELIDRQIEEPVSLSDLACELGISLACLKKRFRDETGIPPYEYVLQRKNDVAKDLLRAGELSVTEIAFRLGFPSSQHFAATFKKMNAMTPTLYRNTSSRKKPC